MWFIWGPVGKKERRKRMKRAKWMQFGFLLGPTCVSPGVCQKDEVRLELSAAQCRELAPESTVHTICRDLIMINLLFQKSYALLRTEAASESKKLFVTSSKATFTCKFETIQPISWDAFSRWLVRVHNSAANKNSASLSFFLLIWNKMK